MTRKKLYLLFQTFLCSLTAILLSVAALQLYLDGASRQAQGDMFYYMFTRERVISRLQPLIPLFFTSIGFTIAGNILGIQDEDSNRIEHDNQQLRRLSCSPCTSHVHHISAIRCFVMLIAVVMIVAGILNGGLENVLAKGAAICTECVGLG